jgi:Na+/glutamate symporter
MHHNIKKISNVTLDLLIWVGLWSIYDNILGRFKLHQNTLLLVYILTLVFAFSLIYIINGKLSYTSSLYE